MIKPSTQESNYLTAAVSDVFQGVREKTLLAAGPCLFIASLVLLDSINYYPGANWRFATAISLLGLAVALWFLRPAHSRLAGWLLVTASFLACLVVLVLGNFPLMLILLVGPVGIACLTAGKLAGLGTAAVSTLVILLFPERLVTIPQDIRWMAVAVLWLFLGMAWLMLSPLLETVEEALTSQKRSIDLLEKTRDTQENFQKSLAELTNSNNQLIRLHRLAQNLRQVAEDERRSKEQFVANVSHELRTPLNMIIGFCEMILKAPHVYGPGIPVPLLSDLDVVLRNSQHLSGLIDDILDLSQIDAGRMALSKEHVLLNGIIEDAVVSVRSLFLSKNLSLEYHIPEGLPSIYCDPIRIREVMLNLLSNAGRFTEQGGIRINAWQQENFIYVSIADTGIGMSREEQIKVFQPFQQADGSIRRKYNGTGLGLSISKSLVELHDGKMWVESEKGKGTIFFFRLPVDPVVIPLNSATRWVNVNQTRADFEPLPQYKPKQGSTSLPVVILEQGTALQKLLKRYLGDMEILPVTTLEEAGETIAQNPSRVLVINDDGSGLCQDGGALPDNLPYTLPVMVCSVPELDEVNATLGALSYLIKPISREKLLKVLEDLQGPPARILVVDDDPEAQRLIKRMLSTSRHRYQVFKASDGIQALELLRRSKMDAILLDLTMPNMDGFQFLEIKRQDPDLAEIPVILVTARDPFGQPIISKTLTVSLEGGLSAQRLVNCIASIMAILSPLEQSSGPKAPETAPA